MPQWLFPPDGGCVPASQALSCIILCPGTLGRFTCSAHLLKMAYAVSLLWHLVQWNSVGQPVRLIWLLTTDCKSHSCCSLLTLTIIERIITLDCHFSLSALWWLLELALLLRSNCYPKMANATYDWSLNNDGVPSTSCPLWCLDYPLDFLFSFTLLSLKNIVVLPLKRK